MDDKQLDSIAHQLFELTKQADADDGQVTEDQWTDRFSRIMAGVDGHDLMRVVVRWQRLRGVDGFVLHSDGTIEASSDIAEAIARKATEKLHS
jgi:hypothetical protein